MFALTLINIQHMKRLSYWKGHGMMVIRNKLLYSISLKVMSIQ